MVVVVMGVSGSGKSTSARRWPRPSGWDFQEGDDLHPPANIDKMRAGHPAGRRRPPTVAGSHRDVDRRRTAPGRQGVVACSALKRTYRERLRGAGAGVRFVCLTWRRDKLAQRLQQRDHFMPPSLLASQLQTLEAPGADEAVLAVDGGQPLAASVAQIRAWLQPD